MSDPQTEWVKCEACGGAGGHMLPVPPNCAHCGKRVWRGSWIIANDKPFCDYACADAAGMRKALAPPICDGPLETAGDGTVQCSRCHTQFPQFPRGMADSAALSHASSTPNDPVDKPAPAKCGCTVICQDNSPGCRYLPVIPATIGDSIDAGLCPSCGLPFDKCARLPDCE